MPKRRHVHLRAITVLCLALVAFQACKKKGGGYMTEPTATIAH